MKCIHHNDPYISWVNDSKISSSPLLNFLPFVFTVSGVAVWMTILLAIRRMCFLTSTQCYSLWSSRTINMIDIIPRSINFSCTFIQFRLPHAVIAIFEDRHSFANFASSHTHILTIKADRKSFAFLVHSFNGTAMINGPQNYHYSEDTQN